MIDRRENEKNPKEPALGTKVGRFYSGKQGTKSAQTRDRAGSKRAAAEIGRSRIYIAEKD